MHSRHERTMPASPAQHHAVAWPIRRSGGGRRGPEASGRQSHSDKI
jgi:hypothetical protein